MLYAGIILAEIFILFILVRKLHLGFGRIFYKLTRSETISAYLLAFIFFPGTFVHEMSHFLAALFLLVPVGKVNLFPEIADGGSVKLGSVNVAETDFVRRTIVGFAPVLFGTSTILAVLYFAVTRNLLVTPWSYLAVVYIVFEIANTMFLSRRDLAGSWKMLVFILVIFIAVYGVGIRIDIQTLSGIFTEDVMRVLRTASLFFAIPVSVDFVFVVVFRLLRIV